MPEEIFRKLLLLSASGGLMACVLLLIRALFWRKIPPRVLYALWSLPVFRLLLPFAPESRLSVFQPLVRSGAAVPDVSYAAPSASPGNLASGGGPAVASFPLPSAASSPSPMRIAAMIWLSVAAALLLYFLAANLFLRLKLNRLPRFSDARVNKVLAQCRAELRVGAPVRLAVTERPKPPAVFGVFRPVILFPRAAAEGCSENELRYIFLHELTHIRRYDGAFRLLTLFLKAVNWFNPILWYALHKMSEDCEISCDACVLARLSGKERRSYGDAVVGMIRAVADGRASAGAVGFADSFSKRRIFMIAKVQKTSRCRAVAAVLALMLAGCASLPPQSVSSQAPFAQSGTVSAPAPDDGALGSPSDRLYQWIPAPADSGNVPEDLSAQMESLRKTKSEVDVIIASMKEDQNLSDTEKAAQEKALDEKRRALTEEMESLQNLISAKTSGQSAGSDPSEGLGPVFTRMVYDRGYKMLADSGVYGYPVLLPESFTAEKNGSEVGKFLSSRNELSKKNGLDFSSHLGEKVYYCTCGGEKRAPGDMEESEKTGGPGSADLVALYDADRRLIAFWEAPEVTDKDESDVMVFTQILSDKSS